MRTTTIRRRAWSGAVLTIILVLTACSEGNDPGPAAGSASDPPSVASPKESEGGGRSGYGDGETGSDDDDGDDGGGGKVAMSIVVANFQFSPATVKVSEGDTIELKNTNPQTPHTFTVLDEDIDVSLDPGATSTVTIDLDPGVYPYECTFHSSMGMRGTLKIA